MIAALATVLPAAQVEAQAPESRGALDDVRRVTLDEAAAYPNPTVGLTHERLDDSGVSASESYFTLAQRLEWPAPGAEATAREDAETELISFKEAALSPAENGNLHIALANAIREERFNEAQHDLTPGHPIP